jgi:uroporphyrinogen-III synthase
VKRVLVLRAREDAERTSEKLRAMGSEPLLSPVLEIVATDAAIPKCDYDAVLATSAKGVEHVALDGALRAMPLHAVGARTAKIARELGWRVELVAGNARALLPLLCARYKSPARFLYLAGRDRQADLENGLRAAGHEAVIVETYAARAALALWKEAREALAKGDVAAVLHYSKRSAEIFLELTKDAALEESLRPIPHLALSKDVAAPLEHALGVSPLVAEKPDEEHLLALLLNI